MKKRNVHMSHESLNWMGVRISCCIWNERKEATRKMRKGRNIIQIKWILFFPIFILFSPAFFFTKKEKEKEGKFKFIFLTFSFLPSTICIAFIVECAIERSKKKIAHTCFSFHGIIENVRRKFMYLIFTFHVVTFM